MKSVAILAGLTAGLAAASHHGHQHAHHNVRRGDNGVVTSTHITTEWTYVTVTQGVPDSSPEPPAASAPSSSNDQVQAAAVTAAPAPASSLDANAQQEAINSAQQASNIAHQQSMIALQAGLGSSSAAAAPTQASAVVPSSSPVAAPASSQPASSAAAAPAPSGGAITAIGTYYGAQGGYGSCGQVLSDDGHTVALPDDIMQKTSKKLCGATISITCNGQTYSATVQDSCPGCDGSNGQHIDIVQGWAHEIDPNIDVSGHADLTWEFVDPSMQTMFNSACSS